MQRVQRRRLERGGAELEQERAHLREGRAHEPAQALEVPPAVLRVALPHRRQRLGDEGGAVDALRHGVVQVAGERLALLARPPASSPCGAGGRSRSRRPARRPRSWPARSSSSENAPAVGVRDDDRARRPGPRSPMSGAASTLPTPSAPACRRRSSGRPGQAAASPAMSASSRMASSETARSSRVSGWTASSSPRSRAGLRRRSDSARPSSASSSSVSRRTRAYRASNSLAMALRRLVDRLSARRPAGEDLRHALQRVQLLHAAAQHLLGRAPLPAPRGPGARWPRPARRPAPRPARPSACGTSAARSRPAATPGAGPGSRRGSRAAKQICVR